MVCARRTEVAAEKSADAETDMTFKDVLAQSSSLRPHSPAAAPEPIARAEALRPNSCRLGLWQIDSGAQCSIIGTCLSDRDLRDAVRKHLTLDAPISNYEIHCHCAHASQTDGPLARTLTKILHRRYAGAVNLAAKAETEAEVLDLWIRLRDSGQIAAGYWGVMSRRGIPDSVKKRVFGEVHMLSHLQGRSIHQATAKLAETQRRCLDVGARLKRSESGRQEALVERDRALAERDSVRATFAERKARASDALTEREAARTITRLRNELAQRERALVIARTRARQAEARLESIVAAGRRRRRSAMEPGTARPRDIPAVSVFPPDLGGTRILYIGGRNTVIRHLQPLAASCAAEFQHHDGGVEDSMHRLVEMVERCDAVICPVDCVSHGACRLAKSSCQRLNKVFMPIQKASRASFERALAHLYSLRARPQFPPALATTDDREPQPAE
jgi:hypothetical protein